MSLPVTISFVDIDPSPALRARIEDQAQQLTRYAPRLMDCHVSVRLAEHRHHSGNRFLVRAQVKLPGALLIAGDGASADHSHEDPYIAVRDTFDALRRQLEAFVEQQRGDVKTHARPGPPTA